MDAASIQTDPDLLYNIPMTRKHLVRAIFTLFLAMALLPPGTGTAGDAPRISHLTPGGKSQVISPIPVSADIQPEPGGLVRIELMDGRGQTITRQLLRLNTDKNNEPQSFTTELPFEIPLEAEDALLTLSLLDSLNRPVALRSTQITLLSSGKAQIEPHRVEVPWVTITHPKPQDSFNGGRLLVEGSVTPLTDKPIVFELITERTRVIGASQLAIEKPEETFDFKIMLYYAFITEQSEARLVVRQTADTNGAIIILDSFPVILMP